MKKILKYSTILGAAAMLTATVATADTGGYVRVKNMESHFKSIGFNQTGCIKSAVQTQESRCKFASSGASNNAAGSGLTQYHHYNELKWNKDDGEGLIVGADFGFFRLEVEGTYQDAKAISWRQHTATGGTVHQGRLFGNVVVEPFDLIELLGEFGGIEPLVKYNPAHYGISPYAMYGYGVMGGVVENLSYTRSGSAVKHNGVGERTEQGAWAGGATTAVNVGAGVNIGLDRLAKGFSDLSGTNLPEYFKLPIEFSVGYHWQVGLDDLLWESMDEELGVDDGGITYSVGLKW